MPSITHHRIPADLRVLKAAIDKNFRFPHISIVADESKPEDLVGHSVDVCSMSIDEVDPAEAIPPQGQGTVF